MKTKPDLSPSSDKGTVILFYKYINVKDPEKEREIQTNWWEELNIFGRMRLSVEGVNANLYGKQNSIEEYKRRMETSEYWQSIDYKHSNPVQDSVDEDPFNGVRKIRVSQEITGSGPMKNFLPTALGGNGGKHLSPSEFDELVTQSFHDKDTLIIDTRNHYETVVGKFKNAIDPKLRCFGEFPSWVEANKEKLKHKKIGLYCTGGIRCEKASSFVKSLDLNSEVFQLKGGIHNYLSEFSENSGKEKGIYIESVNDDEVGKKKEDKEEVCLFKGVNFQFDNRFSEESCGYGEKRIEGKCVHCFSLTCHGIKEDSRCSICDNLILLCETCYQNSTEVKYCPEHHLLSESWERYLMTLYEKKVWSLNDFQENLKALKFNLNIPVYKQCNGWKVDRIADLKVQISRIEQFLNNMQETKELGENEDIMDENISTTEAFIPYVPLLNP